MVQWSLWLRSPSYPAVLERERTARGNYNLINTYVGASYAPAWTKKLHSLSPICKQASARFSLFIEAQRTLNSKLHLTT